MPYQALTITSLILTVWISYIAVQNQNQLNNLQRQFDQQQTLQAKNQEPYQKAVIEQLTIATDFIQQQDVAKAQVTAAEQKRVTQQQLFELYKAFVNVQKAELIHLKGDNSKAAELLKKSKDAIWQAGDRYPDHKATLQGLMQPIDETSNQWQAGNAEASAEIVYQTLQQVLDKLNAAQ